MGGEKPPEVAAHVRAKGSPPHGRGKESSSYDTYHPHRITPAWAGKSRHRTDGPRRSRDHPRMGGEKVGIAKEQYDTLGSPPHGRGKGQVAGRHAGKCRITPAWAGKSVRHGHPARNPQDHPRMGGEKQPGPDTKLCIEGSPPHGRGKD